MSAADEKKIGYIREKNSRQDLCVNREYPSRMNHELYELYHDVELARRVNIRRLRWLGHAIRMDAQGPARMVFETDPADGSRRRRRPSTRWRDQV